MTESTVRPLVSGHTAGGLDTLSSVFSELASQDPTTGQAVAVVKDGALRAHLWSGPASEQAHRSWRSDTIAVIFSVSKAVLSVLTLRLAQEGKLKLDIPVSAYWPEFAQAGKGSITVADVLSHRAGLIALDPDFTTSQVIDGTPLIDAIARQRPLWEPGTQFGYHALTYGWIIGEVLCRVTGVRPQDLVRRYLAAPLGIDLWLGLPQSEFLRLAHLLTPPPIDLTTVPEELRAAFTRTMKRPEIVRSLTLGGAFPPALYTDSDGFNDPAVIAAGVPAAGMVASAPALATLFASTVHPVKGLRTLDDESVEIALTVRSSGDNWGGASSPTVRFSAGFMLDGDPYRPLLSSGSFGHDGALGQLAFADKNHNLGFAYITNRSGGLLDQRANRLVEALAADLGIG